MSTKRSADEASGSEEKYEDIDPVVQQENDAKRAKLESLKDTTLEDLPIEIVERILIEAISVEVMGLKLAKGAREKKVDEVISRLQSVCSQWNSILDTSFFRKEVQRIVEAAARDTIHLEILHQIPIRFFVYKVATMRDEIFLLCKPNGKCDGKVYAINVLDRSNMTDVKAVISLPGIEHPKAMAGCSVSNCLYLLNEESECSSVLRIAKDEEQQYKVSTWKTHLYMSHTIMTVSSNGDLILVSRPQEPYLTVMFIYNANGSFQDAIGLRRHVFGCKSFSNVMQKPNGNLVLACMGGKYGSQLTEITMSWKIVRRYKSTILRETGSTSADVNGRIFMYDGSFGNIELLDSEFNRLECSDPLPDHGQWNMYPQVHFNSDRNEIVRISYSLRSKHSIITIFRFTEK